MRAERREEKLTLSEETENNLMGNTQSALSSAGLVDDKDVREVTTPLLCSKSSVCLGRTQALWERLRMAGVNRWVGDSVQRALEALIWSLPCILQT